MIHQHEWVRFQVRLPAGEKLWRVKIEVDTTIGTQRFGQQVEALISTIA